MKTQTEQVNRHKGKAAMKEERTAIWESWPHTKLARYVDKIRENIAWVVYLKGGNNYKEGTWPPHGDKKEPVEWWPDYRKNIMEEYGNGDSITEEDIPDQEPDSLH